MVTTFKPLTERVQGGKMGLMLIEKVKKKTHTQKTWKGQTALTSQFFLTGLGPTYSYTKNNIMHSYNTDTASVLTKNQKKKKKKFLI